MLGKINMMQTDIYEENAGLRQLKIHDPTIHDATMHDSCINYLFFSCHEKTWVRETAYFTSGILLDNSKSDLIPSLQSKKLIKLHVISFQQSTSYFTARGVLFVQKFIYAIHGHILLVLSAHVTSGFIYISSSTRG